MSGMFLLGHRLAAGYDRACYLADCRRQATYRFIARPDGQDRRIFYACERHRVEAALRALNSCPKIMDRDTEGDRDGE